MQIKNLNIYFFMLVLIGITILVFLLFKPFLSAIFTAAILAATFRSPYKLLLKNIKNKMASSLLTCFLVLFVIVIPMLIVLGLVVNELGGAYQKFVTNNEFYHDRISEIIHLVKSSPLVQSFSMERFLEQEQIGESLKTISGNILMIFQKTYQNVIASVLWIFVMFFALYYFLIDGKKFIDKIMYLSPLKDKYEGELSFKFTSMTRATLKGTIIVGLVQGILGGLMFWIAGIPSYVIWGVIMTILSIIPAVGAGLVWGPAGIILLFIGNIWQGVFVLSFGILVISFIDNILRPKLVGNDTEMHPLLVFFATLGGLITFGIIGFVIGPVIMALFLSLWDIYGKEFKSQLNKFNA
ncbi:MAG: AI-2E family transporter [Candidatus Moranbacteria bacterium]|jgi:predicted PurR-regulated permease PerM|nr:AI-2E family transporter [Candidatus Moranbacteria bacterium]MDX9855684.1 AI-2E family transporter [Candidatus Moranbacteria bacterium]